MQSIGTDLLCITLNTALIVAYLFSAPTEICMSRELLE